MSMESYRILTQGIDVGWMNEWMGSVPLSLAPFSLVFYILPQFLSYTSPSPLRKLYFTLVHFLWQIVIKGHKQGCCAYPMESAAQQLDNSQVMSHGHQLLCVFSWGSEQVEEYSLAVFPISSPMKSLKRTEPCAVFSIVCLRSQA